MATSISATPSVGIAYTLTETNSDTILTESTSVANTITLVNGIGTGMVTMGAYTSGYLPSGGTIVHDITSLTKPVFGSSVSINFTNVKGVVITANWSGPPASGSALGTGIPADFPTYKVPHLTINTAGTDGFTDLLNGQDGYIKVGHNGSWSLVDFTGIPTSSAQKKINLVDSGSGIAYEMIVVGVTG